MPMLPFLASDLFRLVLDLLGRFVKRDTLKDLTLTKLLKLDLKERSHHLASSAVEIGFADQQQMRQLKKNKKINEQKCLTLRLDTKECLMAIMSKPTCLHCSMH